MDDGKLLVSHLITFERKILFNIFLKTSQVSVIYLPWRWSPCCSSLLIGFLFLACLIMRDIFIWRPQPLIMMLVSHLLLQLWVLGYISTTTITTRILDTKQTNENTFTAAPSLTALGTCLRIKIFILCIVNYVVV